MKVEKPQRRSHQRDVIETELCKLKSHPTAAELYERVREIIPKISLGTVYRNLEQLAEYGSIKKITNGNSIQYDGNVSEHNHIRCVNCDKITDVYEMPYKDISKDHESLAGYKILDCNVEFLGICPDCQNS